MSKRLQVLLEDQEYRMIVSVSRSEGRRVSDWVRECLRERVRESKQKNDPEVRLGRLMRYAKHEGPTGDIETVLAEIERGRSE